jgi:hypothetical protein
MYKMMPIRYYCGLSLNLILGCKNMKKIITIVLISSAGIMHAMDRDVEQGRQETLLNTGLVMPVLPHSSHGVVASHSNNSPVNTPGIILHSLEHTESTVPMPITMYVPQAAVNVPWQQYYARTSRLLRINPIRQESREYFIIGSAIFAVGIMTGMKIMIWSGNCDQ